MKLHWGHGIVTGGLMFMSFVVFMTSQMIGEKVDLVAPDYYERGINYQKEIEQKRIARSDLFTVTADDKLHLNPVQGAGIPSGKHLKLEFYRPSEKEKDFSDSIRTESVTGITYTNPKLTHGMWKLRISWNEGQQTRFCETSFYKP